MNTMRTAEHNKDLTTIETKDFNSPVQVDTEKIFLYRKTSPKGDGDNKKASLTGDNDAVTKARLIGQDTMKDKEEKERNMRAKTAHIGLKASHASQGEKIDQEEVNAGKKPEMPEHRRTWSREERTYEGLAARAKELSAHVTA